MISVPITEDEPLIAEAHGTYRGRLRGASVAAVAHIARDAMRAASDAEAGDAPADPVVLDTGLPDANGMAPAADLPGTADGPDIMRSPPNVNWRWCISPQAVHLRGVPGPARALVAATGRRCRLGPTRPARPRSTAC
ncbi:hypothetical protein HNP02_007558 [Mycobacterium sp. AZCC_0083]|nr:hypothetical protein [Mycobacterium sp. AZCC_0083]